LGTDVAISKNLEGVLNFSAPFILPIRLGHTPVQSHKAVLRFKITAYLSSDLY